MEPIQLFLTINKPGLNNEWNTNITAALKALPSMEQLQVIEENESSNTQISMTYNISEVSLNRIEEIIEDSGATVTDVNIHFLSGITGVADPYRSSAISVGIDEDLKKINGVLGGAISSRGELKVTLDITSEDKQKAVEEILKVISHFGSAI